MRERLKKRAKREVQREKWEISELTFEEEK